MTITDTLRGLSAAAGGHTDAELLTRFVRTRDEAAFAELLRRHGPTVFGVCRRALADTHAAEDAFQAVFLVLARKAGTVRPPGMVGNFLYGVAVRTAMRARAMAAKRATREQRAAAAKERGASADPDHKDGGDPDVLKVIDDELAALPGVYRAAFVACEVNGRTRRQAAKELGWPEGTLAGRLAKARELLAARLRKRGIALGAATFAAGHAPPALAANTLAAVRELIAVGAATAVAPAAQTLSNEVLRTMSGFKLKLLAAGLLIALAAGATARVGAPAEPPAVRAERTAIRRAPVPKEPPMEWKEATPITFDPHPHGDRVTGVAFDPKGKFIAVAVGNQVRLLDAATKKQVNEHALTAKAPATTTGVAFSPDGKTLAMTAKDYVFLYTDLGKSPSVSSDASWKTDGLDAHQVTWLSDGALAASNGAEALWRHKVGKEFTDTGWKWPGGKRGQPHLLAALPGQSVLLLASGNTEKEAKEVQVAAAPPMSSPQSRLAGIGHGFRPTFAAVAADGTRIVTADEGGTLIVWEGEKFDFKEKSRIERGPTLAAFALAPDGKTVAVVRTHGVDWLGALANRSSTVFELFVFDVTDPPAKPAPIWKTDTRDVPGKINGPVSLAFSPDGKTLLAAFADPFTDDAKLYGPIPKSLGVKVWELGPKK